MTLRSYSCFKSGNVCDMWCHVKSTTCTNLNLPHTTETTGTTALTGQCRQPQAPLAKRPGTSSLRKAVRHVVSAPSLTTRATSGTTSTQRHIRRTMESSSEPDSDDALPKSAYQELLEAFRQRHCISRLRASLRDLYARVSAGRGAMLPIMAGLRAAALPAHVRPRERSTLPPHLVQTSVLALLPSARLSIRSPPESRCGS